MAKKKTKSSKRNTNKKSAKTSKRAPKVARKAAKKTVAPIPTGYYTLTPYLVCRGAAKAIEFYTKAFDAREKLRMSTPDGGVAHAELRIGNSIVMLGDEMPAMGATAPETLGGTATGIFIYTKDVDKAFAKAIAAGAKADQPPTDMFWGDRYAKLTDPFGHKWSMATRIEDLSPKEMAKRGEAAMSQPPPGAPNA
jgi:PhnB protein